MVYVEVTSSLAQEKNITKKANRLSWEGVALNVTKTKTSGRGF